VAPRFFGDVRWILREYLVGNVCRGSDELRQRASRTAEEDQMQMIGAAATFCLTFQCATLAWAAMVGQTVTTAGQTMACPSVAALGRFEKLSLNDPEHAAREASKDGCEQVTASDRGLVNKVAKANICVIFSAGHGCLWIPASAVSDRVDLGPPAPAFPDIFGGLQKFFGGFR
jgi:hypothetical protein